MEEESVILRLKTPGKRGRRICFKSSSLAILLIILNLPENVRKWSFRPSLSQSARFRIRNKEREREIVCGYSSMNGAHRNVFQLSWVRTPDSPAVTLSGFIPMNLEESDDTHTSHHITVISFNWWSASFSCSSLFVTVTSVGKRKNVHAKLYLTCMYHIISSIRFHPLIPFEVEHIIICDWVWISHREVTSHTFTFQSGDER